MKLQILIPQYDETEETVRPLLDSIALQQAVDFDDIGVIICNDGSDTRLSREFLSGYPFRVEYHLEPHRGVSATRNACLDHATADYVMFCDADDMFCHMCGLWMVFNEINLGGFDSLTSCFIEETRDPETRTKPLFIDHKMDSTFVHGKVHRRRYLTGKRIRFNDRLTIHEDSYFNIQCQQFSPDVKYCPTAFYLWKWRDTSVCRHDPKYLLKTYNNMLDSNDALLDAFLCRGLEEKARDFCTMMIYDAYYNLNKPEWVNQENKDYRDATERRFGEYFRKRRELWDKTPDAQKMAISNSVRARCIGEGMMMEAITINDWLKKVVEV